MSESSVLNAFANGMGYLRTYRDMPTQVTQTFALVAARDVGGEGPTTMRDIMARTSMSQASTSRAVATLTGVGYMQIGKRVAGLDWVIAESDPGDLKVKLLRLSKTGREVAKHLAFILSHSA